MEERFIDELFHLHEESIRLKNELFKLHEESVRLKIVRDYVNSTEYVNADILKLLLTLGKKEGEEE